MIQSVPDIHVNVVMWLSVYYSHFMDLKTSEVMPWICFLIEGEQLIAKHIVVNTSGKY